MEDRMDLATDCTSSSDNLMQLSGNCKDNDDLSNVLLDDFDSYWEDINDRLTISRMVNDSIIKGMVNAVTEEATEKIAQKDLELALLKEKLQFYESDAYKTSLFESQKVRESHAEVIGTDCQSANQLAMIKQLSSLRQELNFISKIFSTAEIGHPSLNGSQEDYEELANGKRKDNFHHKDFRNHIAQASSLKETNGKQEDPKTTLRDAQLNHMSKDELISHFRHEMTLMKREHETLVQAKTEEYFSLRREFLKEKGSSFSLRREKEFETFSKKIPEVIVKLDNLLMENQKLPVPYENNELVCSLTKRIDTLLSEKNQATIKCDIEDSDLEYIIMQEIFVIIFKEAARDVEGTARHIKKVYDEENDRRVSLEALLLESEKTLGSVIEEKEQLKQKILRFSELLDEKEKLALEKGSLLTKEKERYDLIYQELNLLKNEIGQKERLVSEVRRESGIVKSKYEEALRKVQLCEKERIELDQKLKGAYEEIKKLHGIIQERGSALSLLEAKETEHRRQSESIIASVQRLFQEAADFDRRTMEVVEKNNLRLRRLQGQLDPLIQNATLFRSMEVVYKQRLENRYSDLQKAEAEVDLLGDEVDTLLSLLEKIYIALHHYSPVLQHYPGIMDTLKLIKRELSDEIAYNQKK